MLDHTSFKNREFMQLANEKLLQKLYAVFNTDGQVKIYNRLEHNFHLSNKKALFRNIVRYYRHRDLDPFEMAIPLTFHIR